MSGMRINEQMLEAGVAALLEQLPMDVLSENAIEPTDLAASLFQAMSGLEWMPIGSGPRTGVNVLLASVGATPADVRVGIGMWVDDDDDSGSGRWSTESWWGAPATHWRPLPQPPQQTESS